MPPLEQRLHAIDWPRVELDLDATGVATTGPLLDAHECATLRATYDAPDGFRSRVIMARHGFGRGEYRYFDDPIPSLVATIRTTAYEQLAPIANRWAERSKRDGRFPSTHVALRAECAAAGQTRPTPLLLRYGPGDYNCLHQDLYGDLVFPLQLVILLDRPGQDFEGGELVLTEQRPRMQSRVQVVPLGQGEAAIFAVRDRPVNGTRGTYRVTMRHGVSVVRSGSRTTLGVIFHDAP